MIHKNASLQEDKGLKSGLNQRQPQGQRYRYLIDLPQFSAVVQNPQSMKNLASSEASLLQKIAFQNNKISNSSIFQENKEKIFDTRVVDQMRFSFNNNQSKEKQSNYNELVAKYHNQQSKVSSNFNTKNESFQKKPSKQISKEQFINVSMETIKSKYITNNDKKIVERIKIIDEQNQFNDSFSKDKNTSKQEGSQTNRHLDKAFQKVTIKDRQIRDQIIPLSKQVPLRPTNIRQTIDKQLNTANNIQKQTLKFQIQSTQTPHLEKIFQTLDCSKTGKIDKYNCNIKCIKEEFQLIFGLIFYRIKFCNDSFNKKDFINLCYECLKLLKRQRVINLFKQSNESQRQKNGQKQRQQSQRILKQKQRIQKIMKQKEEKYKLLIEKQEKELLMKQKEQKQKILKERDQRQRKIKEIQLKEKYDRQQRLRIMKQLEQKQKIIKQSKEQQRQLNIKRLEQIKEKGCENCKSLSKFERKQISHSILQDSPPKQRISSIQQNVNINKREFVELKEVREQKQTLKHISKQKVHHTYKYETNPISSRALDSMRESHSVLSYKQKKIVQTIKENITNQQHLAKLPSSKKKRNISQSILREHKRSLQEIHKLNNKVQKYINSKPDVQLSRTILQKEPKLHRYYQSFGLNPKI